MSMDEIRGLKMLPVDLMFRGIFFSECVSVIKIIRRKFMIPEEIFPVVESQLYEQSMILSGGRLPLCLISAVVLFHLSFSICHK